LLCCVVSGAPQIAAIPPCVAVAIATPRHSEVAPQAEMVDAEHGPLHGRLLPGPRAGDGWPDLLYVACSSRAAQGYPACARISSCRARRSAPAQGYRENGHRAPVAVASPAQRGRRTPGEVLGILGPGREPVKEKAGNAALQGD